MTGFEPRTSGVGSDRFTNWATTTAPIPFLLGDDGDAHFGSVWPEKIAKCL